MATPETAARIVRREFPEAEVREVTDVSGGQKSTFVVALADRTVVVAVCGETCDRGRFAVEPGVLDLVRRRTDVPVPVVLARDLSTDADPAPNYVTRSVEGYEPSGRYKYLPRDRRAGLVTRAGEILGSLHRQATFEAVGRLEPADGGVRVEPADSWRSFLSSKLREWTDELSGSRFADLVPTFERVSGRIVDAAPRDVEPTLLHFDYRPANLVVRGGDVAAVLDWGLSVSGHAEYDLFKAEKNFLLSHFRTPSIRDTHREHLLSGYRGAHDLAPGWEDRRAAYRVAYKLESLRSFDRWTAGMPAADRERMADRLRAELDEDLAGL